jgi:hypothetical protein
VLQQLIHLRAADFRATPPLHITPRVNGMRPSAAAAAAAASLAAGGGSAAHSPPIAGSSVAPTAPSAPLPGSVGPNAAAAGKQGAAAAEGSQSFYVDGSMDSDLGWSTGASGMSLSAPLMRGRQAAALPRIREAHGEGADKTPHAADGGPRRPSGGGGGSGSGAETGTP